MLIPYPSVSHLRIHTAALQVYGDPRVHPQKESYWGHVNPIGYATAAARMDSHRSYHALFCRLYCGRVLS